MSAETEIKRLQSPYQSTTPPEQTSSQQRGIIIGAIIGLIVILGLMAVFVWFLLQPATPTERIRDIFIIFMALESILLGFVLILLVYQLARLTNLLQNEIKPILESTNETVNTLRGTTTFISDNLVQPVISMNEYLAAISSILNFVGIVRKKKKK
jgi:hypothetical protein